MNYRTYLSGKGTTECPRLTLLLQVDGSGHAREGYRFGVEGGPWDADIWTGTSSTRFHWEDTGYGTSCMEKTWS